MLVVLTYDVETANAMGARRLRRVAKICESYGVRVQASVFELDVDTGQLALIKTRLLEVIDLDKDSIRFYRLGNNYQHKIETLGKEPTITPYDPLIL